MLAEGRGDPPAHPLLAFGQWHPLLLHTLWPPLLPEPPFAHIIPPMLRRGGMARGHILATLLPHTSTWLGLAPLSWCLSPRAPSFLPGLSSSYSSAPGSPPRVVSASCCLRHLGHFHILLLPSPYVPRPPWQCCPMAKAFFQAFLPCSRKEIKLSPRPSGCVCRDHGRRPSPRVGLRPNSSTLSQNFWGGQHTPISTSSF